MANPLQPALIATAQPVESLLIDDKKDVDSFLKAFRKRKRNITTKLNKNQINLSQVISYHENLINYLEELKNKRIDNIILHSQEYTNKTGSFEITADSDGSLSRKRSLDDEVGCSSKKQKLMSVDEELNKDSLMINNEEINVNVDSSVRDSIDKTIVQESMEVDEDDKIGEIISNEEIEDRNESVVESSERITHTVTEEDESQSDNCENNDETFPINDKIDNQSISIETNSSDKNVAKPVASVSIPRNFKTPSMKSQIITANIKQKTSSLSKQNTSLKTPQTTLFKSKFHNDFSISKLNNSLTKSQILPKKNVVDIRKLQDKQATEKRQKIEEEARRKETQLKMSAIKTMKNNLMTQKNHTLISSNKLAMPSSKVLQSSSKIATTISKPIALTRTIASINNGKPIQSINKKTISTDKTQESTILKPINSSNVVKPQTKSQINSSNLPMIRTESQINSSNLPIIRTESQINSKTLLQMRTESQIHSSNPSNMLTKSPPIVDLSQSSSNIFKTPFTKKRLTMMSDSCIALIKNHENYDITDLMDNSSDDDDENENNVRQAVPTWCNKKNGTLCNLVKYQSKHCQPAEIFKLPESIPIDIRQIFGINARVKEGCLEKWIAV